MAAADGSAADWPADAVEVGRVLGAWGIKGGIKVKAFATEPQALFSSKRWYLAAPQTPGPSVASNPWPLLLRVLQAKEQADAVVATVEDVQDRDAAEALKGARVFVPRTSFPAPGEGEFYWVDLIGMVAINRAGAELGRVVGLIETGPHCVLRVQPAGEQAAEMLIPFVDAYIDGVDQAARRITADWEADYGE